LTGRLKRSQAIQEYRSTSLITHWAHLHPDRYFRDAVRFSSHFGFSWPSAMV